MSIFLCCTGCSEQSPDQAPDAASLDEHSAQHSVQHSVMVGSEGGVAEFWVDGERLILEIPAGALQKELVITVDPSDEPVEGVVGRVYDIGPPGTQFDKPVVVLFPGRDPGKSPKMPQYRLMTKSGDAPWALLPKVERTGHIAGETTHFSLFAAVIDPDSVGRVTNQQGTEFNFAGVHLSASDAVSLVSMTVTTTALKYVIEGHTSGSATLTLQGLRPYTEVYIFDGSLQNKTIVTTNADGQLTYLQDLTGGIHHVWLQNRGGTIHISADLPDGGDCGRVGRWKQESRTCYLGKSVPPVTKEIVEEQVEIVTDFTNLDCRTVDQNFQFTGDVVTIDTTGEPIFGPTVVIKREIVGAGLSHCEIRSAETGVLINPLVQTPPLSFGTIRAAVLDSNIVIENTSLAPAIEIVRSDLSLISNNSLDAFEGVVLAASNHVTIANNEINSQLGVTIGAGGLLTDNVVEENNIDISKKVLSKALGYGVSITQGAFKNTIESNHLTGKISLTEGPKSAGILVEGETPFDGTTPHRNIYANNEIRGFHLGLWFIDNARADEVHNNVITANIVGAMKYGSGDLPVTNAFGVPIKDYFLFHRNDVVNNGTPQVSSDHALNLYSVDPNDPSVVVGNFWGTRCDATGDTTFLFLEENRDSNSTDVLDLNPFGIPIAIRDSVSDPSCDLDTDGDNLKDYEELFGIEVFDNDTGAYLGHLDLPGLGADPNIKDIFIEVDYMDTPNGELTPQPEKIKDVVEEFERNGIHLHVDLGEAVIGTEYEIEFNLGGGNKFPETHIINRFDLRDGGANSGLTFSDLDDIYMNNFDQIRKVAFYYVTYGRNQMTTEGGLSTEVSPRGSSILRVTGLKRLRGLPSFRMGLAEIDGDVFSFTNYSLTLNNNNNDSNLVNHFYEGYFEGIPTDWVNNPNAINWDHFSNERISAAMSPPGFAGGNRYFIIFHSVNENEITIRKDYEDITFMHELGHVLGLSHGGFEKEGAVKIVNGQRGEVTLKEINAKPNYPSVMNYLWTTAFTCPPCPPLPAPETCSPTPRLGFSFGLMESRTEDLLQDSLGLEGIPFILSVPRLMDNVCVYPNTGSIDWNRNSAIDNCLNCDITKDGYLSFLRDHPDWANLSFFDRSASGLAPEIPNWPDVYDFGLIPTRSMNAYVRVSVIIKPGSGETPPINIRSQGVLSIALLANEQFDPLSIILAFEKNSSAVTFGLTGEEIWANHCALETIDNDNLLDLLCQFKIQDSGLTVDSTHLNVRVSSIEGYLFGDTVPIRIVP